MTDQLDAPAAGHGQVKNGDINRLRAQCFNHFAVIGGLGGDAHVGMVGQEASQSLAKNLVIIGNQQTNHFAYSTNQSVNNPLRPETVRPQAAADRCKDSRKTNSQKIELPATPPTIYEMALQHGQDFDREYQTGDPWSLTRFDSAGCVAGAVEMIQPALKNI
jgi:hypothetical protein